MSINYFAQLRVGFPFKADLLKKYRKERKETFHEEPRWDPKTGEKIASEKIIDQEEGMSYFFEGQEFSGDDSESLVQAIAESLGCDYDCFGAPFDDDDDFRYAFCVSLKTRNDFGLDCGNIEMGGEAFVSDVVALQPKLEVLRKKLAALGLKPRKPEVFIAATYG